LVAVQVAPVQEPSGRMRWLVLAALKRIEKVVWPVTFWRLPSAVANQAV
jgi:hypothetical protein